MNFRYIQLAVIVSFFSLLPALFLKAQAAIVINEILPKVENPSDQWIELYNNGSEAVSLNQWRIEQTNGDKKSFTLNASAIIQSKNFLVFTGGQTGIVLDRNGDTVKLFDDKNIPIDSQSYFGVIGYFTAVGRSIDGAGVFIACYVPTPGTSNSCPPPTPTPTPLPLPPTLTPQPTLSPYPTQIPVSTQMTVPTTILPATTVSETQMPSTLGVVDTKPNVSKKTIGAVIAIFLSFMWIIGITMYHIGKKHT
jgi:hypothetical protein